MHTMLSISREKSELDQQDKQDEKIRCIVCSGNVSARRTQTQQATSRVVVTCSYISQFLLHFERVNSSLDVKSELRFERCQLTNAGFLEF